MGVVCVHILLVLYGAPFLDSAVETVHLAALMTVLGIIPPLCVLGTSSSAWSRVYFLHSPHAGLESYVYACTLGAGIGAWLGAVPIPLDWDRPWQVWPISCAIGAMLGHVCAVCLVTFYDVYTANRKVADDKYKLG